VPLILKLINEQQFQLTKVAAMLFMACDRFPFVTEKRQENRRLEFSMKTSIFYSFSLARRKPADVYEGQIASIFRVQDTNMNLLSCLAYTSTLKMEAMHSHKKRLLNRTGLLRFIPDGKKNSP
jgi:hypothetical protein